MSDDFDPVIFGALLADDALEPATAMIAATPDSESQQGPAKHPVASIILAVAVAVAVLWLIL